MPDIYVKDYDTTVSFPDNTSPDVMKAALSKKFPKKEGFFDKVKNVVGKIADASSNALNAESEMMSSSDVLPVAGAIAGGATSWIPAGIIKTAGIVSGQRKGGEELANAVQEKMTPTLSATGIEMMKPVSAPFEYISEKSKQAADWTYDKTGSPLLATAVRTAGEAIPFVAPVALAKGLKGGRGIVTEAINKNIGGMENITTSQYPTSLLPEIGRSERTGFVNEAVPKAQPTDLLQLPAPKNVGEGFTFKDSKPKTILRKAPVPEPDYTVGEVNPDLKIEYAPTISKTGKPFKTEKSAGLSATQNGNIKGEFEVVPVKDGFGYRKIKPFVDEVRAAAIKAEQNDVRPIEDVEIAPVPKERLNIQEPVPEPPKIDAKQPVPPPTAEPLPKPEQPIAPVEKVEPAAMSQGKTQGLSAEMKGADETLQLMKSAKDAGKIKTGSLISAFGKDSVDKLKKMGVVSDNGAVEYDVFAQGHGLDANSMMQSFLDYKNTSITKKAEVNFIKENVINKEKTKQELVKNGYEPANSIEAYNLEKGDSVVRNGEEYKVTGEKEGSVILKDGETIKVPLDETLDIDGVKKQPVKTEKTKAGNQVTISGTSEAENFSLDNPEPPKSLGGKLPEQVKPKNRSIFDITKDINTAMGEKGKIGEHSASQEMTDARARLYDDFLKISDEAKKAGVSFGEQLVKGGFDPDTAKKFVAINKYKPEEIKIEPKPEPIKVQPKQAETNYETEGEPKPSKAALDVNKKLAEKGFDTLPEDELAKYDSHSKAGVVQKVTELVTTDLEKAKEMAKGNIPTPNDIHKQVLFNTVEAIAEKNGDFNTLYDLAQSPIATERSVAAQTLGASAWAKVKNTVVDKIQEVKKARTERAEKQTKDFAKKKTEIRQSLKKEVDNLHLNKEEVLWSKFIKEIAC